MTTAPLLQDAGSLRTSFAPPATLIATLTGPLTGETIDRLRWELARAPEGARHVVLDARALTLLDPVAAARLWLICDQARDRAGLEIRLLGLRPALVRTLRQHPLLGFLPSEDDRLFQDPFADALPSSR